MFDYPDPFVLSYHIQQSRLMICAFRLMLASVP